MKKPFTKSILEKIGFSSEENTVYTLLLSSGPLSPSDIVRKTSIHRPAVYKILEKLLENGLVAVMPKGKLKVYVAESPDRIEKLFQSLEDDFNSEIHDLYDIYEHRDKKPIVTFEEGDKAILNSYSNVVSDLKKNDTYYRYSSGLTLDRAKYLPKDYKLIRDRKNLERLVITDEFSKNKSKLRLGRTIKSVPNDSNLFSHNITQSIYGNKVSFIDYNTKSVITIENPMIAEFQKKIFKLLFKRL